MVNTKLNTGLVLYWSLAQSSNRAGLKAGWSAAGFADAVPDERENISLLKDALSEVFEGKHFLVRPLATRNGFTVVREDRGEDENNFAYVLTAKVFGSEAPVYAGNVSKADEITQAYYRHASRVTSHQVSAALVRILQKLGGTRLRPSGSVYWLHAEKRQVWEQITSTVEAAAEDGQSVAYVISHELDSSSVVAVTDAIVNEVLSEAKRLSEEISSGEIGERAIKSRKAEAADLRKKVTRYEEILGVGLNHLKETLEQVEQTNAVAALLLAANPFQEERHVLATAS